MSSHLYKCVGGPLDGQMISATGDQFRVQLEQIDADTFRTGIYILEPFFSVTDGHRRGWHEWHFRDYKYPTP